MKQALSIAGALALLCLTIASAYGVAIGILLVIMLLHGHAWGQDAYVSLCMLLGSIVLILLMKAEAKLFDRIISWGRPKQ